MEVGAERGVSSCIARESRKGVRVERESCWLEDLAGVLVWFLSSLLGGSPNLAYYCWLYAFIPALLSLNSEIAANRTRTSAFEAIVLYLIVKKSTVPNEPN